MKKLLTILLASSLLVVNTACEEDYLETVPTDQVSAADAFKTTTNAWAALNGIHRIMYSQIYSVQAQGGQSGNMLYMDIMGEDLVFPTSSSSWLRNEYQWISHRSTSASSVYYNYAFYYMIIANANMVISNIDQAEGPQSDIKAIKAEALTYRAWAHFNLVQMFGERFDASSANNGLGVPLVLEPTITPSPRNTVAEVYAQINTDLDDAIGLFAGYTRNNKSHFDLTVAKGIKARVALTQQDYATAVTMAKEARTGYTLMSNEDYLGGFNNYDNKEWMWSSRIVSDQTNYFYSFFAYMSNNFSASVIRTTPKVIFSVLYDKIAEGDIRKKLWDPTGTNTVDFPLPASTFQRFKYHSRKFRVADQSLSIGDVPYMRAAEMYLIEAEALARQGKDADAATALYPLAVNRNPSYVKSTNTGAALIEEIMIQRRVELWGEGFRFYDLKRTNSALNRNGGNHSATYTNGVLDVPAGDKRWQFLIHQDEINNSNGLIEQNPQ
ncbi:SusD-like starch-binding protein associating with outer membrane [Dyadobacter jejuensis]|uniref:SusD-like starch-binding protein associating with outer membrane n=1 Tax=Dyadobacter jejuensis TaxID=1082580 RepID=A0A316AJ84_9BACT|nr:RagB/SusD family nutrient uptake outer membrane protein [Dyadobacter jejuensis]PWJ57642.1 SusD-like starch-binding protein associating with outer membrane [Dyadobacter jejuensis]